MSTYAIGDIQGCYDVLQRLLTHVQFDEKRDTLWSVGDMVNRGSQSLETLRFFKSLGDRHQVVLGNHDLHLIALAYRVRTMRADDTLASVLAAPDCDDLIDWLRHRPLVIYDKTLGYLMSHAGIAPSWGVDQALALSQEVEKALQSDEPKVLLDVLYGNEPDYWRDHLTGLDRLRCIINYCTRMRYCYPDGRLDLLYKGTIAHKPADLIPWYEVPNRANDHIRIIFGHWSALGGLASIANVFPLDTGCVWGGPLTAMRLEDGARFQVASQ